MGRFKDGVQLSDGDKISIKSDGDNYSLTISDAQSSDSGEYKITASSPGGHLSCTASLLVTGRQCSIYTIIHSFLTARRTQACTSILCICPSFCNVDLS